MILLIDNYDSFAHNLARYFQRLGQQVKVVRNDEVDVAGVEQMSPDAIVLSPGPCTPSEAGVSLDLVKTTYEHVPIFGVCLGHQTICAALGGKIIRASEPMHGRSSKICHDGEGVLTGVPPVFEAARYHSLVVDEASLPTELQVTARTADGTIMAVQHRELQVFGVQFHPESILTNMGFPLLSNFLTLACLDAPVPAPLFSSELRASAPRPLQMPKRPVAFQEADPL